MIVQSATGAIIDVLVDGLMVIEARKDQKEGSEMLQSLCWACVGLGGMTGSLMGAFFTENFHPKWTFLIMSFSGLALGFMGYIQEYDTELDE